MYRNDKDNGQIRKQKLRFFKGVVQKSPTTVIYKDVDEVADKAYNFYFF